MRRGKQTVLLLVGSVAAAVGMAAAPVNSSVRVETAVVQPGELVQTVWLTGTVMYKDEQPCISLKSGKISRVHVQPGDTVREGDLLFQMDTASEVQALADLYKARFLHEQNMYGLEAAAVLSHQAELEWQQLEMQLKAAVEAGQIRASGNGVVDTVCVREGEWVNEGTLLGITRGMKKQIVASARSADAALMAEGSAVRFKLKAEENLPAIVERVQPSSETGICMIHIMPENSDSFDTLAIGETVQAEVVTNRKQSHALMPLEAADDDGNVWVVAEGKIQKEAFEWGVCSRMYAQAGAEWAGRTIILNPEQHDLRNGMTVQVCE